MKEITTFDELLEHVDNLLEFFTEHEDVYYVAMDIVHQLRDEVLRAASEEQESE